MGRNAYCMRFRPVPSEGESFMASKQKILIVDDDNNIAELISLYLTKECYDTKIVNDGEEAVREFHSFQPNLILLDLMLPGIDGYQVCREIRTQSNVPIIMLSAKGEVFDKVLGLELGADDYMIKPFDSKELVARVKTQLRRYTRYNPREGTVQEVTEYDFRGLQISKATHKCVLFGEELALTPLEFSILWYLCEHRGNVVSSEELFEHVWGEAFMDSNNTVMSHIARLREKMYEPSRKPKFIKTVWGVGYTIE